MTHHRRGLRRELADDELFDRVCADWRTAGLDPRRAALCRYAEKLTTRLGDMRRADVDELREHGLSDRDVLQLVELVGYYAYVNRVVEGLGVELED